MKRDKISPAAAGLDALTTVKSLEWVTAGPLAVMVISGRSCGIRWINPSHLSSDPVHAAIGGSS